MLAFVMCFAMLLFVAACGDNKVNNGENENATPSPKEKVIDFDEGKGGYSECFSIEVTYTTNPVQKTNATVGGTKFVKYSATGTITVRIEPLAGCRIKAEGVYIDSLGLYLKLGNDHPDEYWKFERGGDSESNYQSKSVIVTLSANGTATITENIKLDFVMDSISAIFFNENALSLRPTWAAASASWHGKVHIYDD